MIATALLESVLSGAIFSLKIAAILVPALVLYDLLAPLPIFGRIGRALAPVLARLGMSPPCTVPLAAGLFLGITYGAGMILPIAEEKRVGPDEVQSLGLFLCTCHAVIEDTFLFAVVGASGGREVTARVCTLVGVRLALAVIVTGGRQSWLRRKSLPA
ncbi:MAG TPA: nucleoside recognition domain-containing protein [Candidatus Polarisedimenticolia bacterium]|jgi:hypothetical protein|nr:nucleoside recognition domain-containing protein [Candidatus Polarisedimenticolia bacterium]